MAKRFLIAANWKMNPTPDGFNADNSPFLPRKEVDVIVFPPFTAIGDCIAAGIATGAQYGRPEPGGAMTGDISMALSKAAGCTWVLCGHSERRERHGETVEDVLEQVNAALTAGLKPILCIGEKIEERAAGKEKQVVEAQLKGSPSGIVIAYEPVWAIGSGKTATPAQAQEMHAFIRSLLPEKTARILYGGSMNPKNCTDLLSQPDIDGGLIGAASLEPDAFRVIVETAARLGA
jgi:triosephosphate isomerase